MLDQIAMLVKQFGQQTVVDNPQIPNDLNNKVMAEAANTISGGLQNIISGGGLQGLINMLGSSNNTSNSSILGNPIVAMMIGHLANKLVNNMGLSPAVASNISTNIIPNVLNSLTQRTVSTAPQDDAFDLNDLVGAFTGGNNSGVNLQDILSQFTQGNTPSIDSNIFDQITQKAQQNQQAQSQAGGLIDVLQGFFK
ncbi:MAG: hypothetical protein ACK5NK_12200 [Niabella sp.]